MVNINKGNSHPSPRIIEHHKGPHYITLEMLSPCLGPTHTDGEGKATDGRPNHPLIIGSPATIQIEINNSTGVTSGAGNTHPSGAPEFTPGF